MTTAQKRSVLPFGERIRTCGLLAALILFAAGLFILLNVGKPVNVGDGSEYYALLFAWSETFRPWMSAKSFEAYGQLVASGQIEGLLPAAELVARFPALRLGDTADFNHFWFYSLVPAVLFKLSRTLGHPFTAHASFMILHWASFSLALVLSGLFHGRKGVIAALLLLIGSPLLWSLDKVHTEFVSCCLVLSAMLLIGKARHVWAALLIAVAATQNPSLGVLALFLLGLRVVSGLRQYAFYEVATIVLIVGLLAIHPGYYFSRYGVLTPQLLAGGADLGRNFVYFYIWLFDPDVGLLPNWFLGAMVLVALPLTCLLQGVKPGTFARTMQSGLFLFSAFYLLVSLYTHSSTTNLNSGGTAGLARYALWYIPLFFPAFLGVITWAQETRGRTVNAGIAAVILSTNNFTAYHPGKSQSFDTPTGISMILQRDAPWLYTPPPEIFVERFSGRGETLEDFKLAAMLGPDCRKLVMFSGESRDQFIINKECIRTHPEIAGVNSEIVLSRLAGIRKRVQSFAFIALDKDFLQDAAKLETGVSVYATALGHGGAAFLMSGWNTPESWGTWSSEKVALVSIPCPAGKTGDFNVILRMVGFTGSRKVIDNIEVSAREEGPAPDWKGSLAALPADVKLRLSAANCQSGHATLRIKVPSPMTPALSNGSRDTRLLGVGLLEVAIF